MKKEKWDKKKKLLQHFVEERIHYFCQFIQMYEEKILSNINVNGFVNFDDYMKSSFMKQDSGSSYNKSPI